MAILKILQYPDLRLRRKGYKVGNVKATKIQKIIADITETLLNAESCAALSATQLDLEDPPNITVIDSHLIPFNKGALCLINPQIISQEGEAIEEEGCMSVYPRNNIYAKVKRASKITVKALDTHGKQIEFVAKDYLARCIQHECDHLQGILYIDRIAKSEHLKLEGKIAKLTPAV